MDNIEFRQFAEKVVAEYGNGAILGHVTDNSRFVLLLDGAMSKEQGMVHDGPGLTIGNHPQYDTKWQVRYIWPSSYNKQGYDIQHIPDLSELHFASIGISKKKSIAALVRDIKRRMKCDAYLEAWRKQKARADAVTKGYVDQRTVLEELCAIIGQPVQKSASDFQRAYSHGVREIAVNHGGDAVSLKLCYLPVSVAYRVLLLLNDYEEC